MKIACVMYGSLKKIGGYQVFTYNLLTALQAAGHQVDLYIPHDEYRRHPQLYKTLPFPTRPLYIFSLRLPLNWHLVYRWLQARHQYDVWQIIGTYPAAYTASVLRGRVPLVLRTHGDDIQKDADLNYGLRLDPRMEQLIQATLHKMDHLIALTQTVVDEYRTLGLPEEKIVEIPNGIDVARYQRPFPPPPQLTTLQLDTDLPLLLTVGRYHPKKGFDIIPAVAARLKAAGVPFNWLVVGMETEHLSPLVAQHAVGSCVHLLPAIDLSTSKTNAPFPELPPDDLIALYQQATLFVFPSRLETFGRVLIEAMAAGTPVITTNSPGCRDVVTADHTGLMVDIGDEAGLAQAIQSLLTTPERQQTLINAGLAHAQHYAWERVAAQYSQLYQEVVT